MNYTWIYVYYIVCGTPILMHDLMMMMLIRQRAKMRYAMNERRVTALDFVCLCAFFCCFVVVVVVIWNGILLCPCACSLISSVRSIGHCCIHTVGTPVATAAEMQQQQQKNSLSQHFDCSVAWFSFFLFLVYVRHFSWRRGRRSAKITVISAPGRRQDGIYMSRCIETEISTYERIERSVLYNLNRHEQSMQCGDGSIRPPFEGDCSLFVWMGILDQMRKTAMQRIR